MVLSYGVKSQYSAFKEPTLLLGGETKASKNLELARVDMSDYNSLIAFWLGMYGSTHLTVLEFPHVYKRVSIKYLLSALKHLVIWGSVSLVKKKNKIA